MATESAFRYRADIDGLRAIAVSAVVLFHAGVPGFGGGYTGVDIFFVISGYLITSLILPDIDARCFSITAFYQRRIRRIFPALIVVIAFCIAVGYLLLAPNNYKTFGQSVVATGAFVSNIFFWQKTSYFGAPASENPLLHTWSLSIEEQFYLFYPMFLLFVYKGSRNLRIAAILSVCLLSLAVCIGLVFYKPSAAFFLGPTRAWELLVGGIIALGFIPRSEHRMLNFVASLAGLVCIISGIVFYSSSMRYPGYAALAPVIGAALLIWSGRNEKTAVHQILATKPFVALGQASYSLYLWHFPLFSYFEYVTLERIGALTKIEICALSLIAAFISLRFVERPFRFPSQKAAARRLVVVAVFAMAVLVGTGAYIQSSGGVPSRIDAASAKYLDAELDRYRHHQECMSLESKIVRPVDACKLGTAGVRPTALLWGDSHAMVTATALERAALRNNGAFLFAASVDCPIGIGFSIDPYVGPSFVATSGYQYCGQYNNEMLKLALESRYIKSIVLSSRWTNWHIGESGSPSEGMVDIRLRDAAGVAKSLNDNKAIFARGFDRLIGDLISAHKEVWIVGPIPEASVRVPKALYVEHLGFDSSDINISTASYWIRNRTILSIFSKIEQKYPVRYIWPQRVLCGNITCAVSENGNPIFLDDNHLSVYGALKTASLYDKIFTTLPDSPTEVRSPSEP